MDEHLRRKNPSDDDQLQEARRTWNLDRRSLSAFTRYYHLAKRAGMRAYNASDKQPIFETLYRCMGALIVAPYHFTWGPSSYGYIYYLANTPAPREDLASIEINLDELRSKIQVLRSTSEDVKQVLGSIKRDLEAAGFSVEMLASNPKKKKPSKKVEPVWFTELLSEPFYRGVDAKGRGVGAAYMGRGLYATWDKMAAVGFAGLAVDQSKKRPGKLIIYRLKPGVRLLDNHSPTMYSIKRKLRVEPWDKIENPIFALALTLEVKEAGYDGVIDSDPYFGMVVFDPTNLTEIGQETI